ncbi:MAG TPA: rhomboid family intramembrane serine protease, partial [Ignavibacteriaceae bacterium]|nr:rhomboid family intramembrane serine protease [Ignavibacteriaceae bacterium]
GDDNRDRRITPLINYLFILLNILVFVFLQDLGSNQLFTYKYSTVPAEILSGKDVVSSDRIVEDPVSGDRVRIPGLQPTPIPVYLTILTSMFMHGGIAHIFGNMLFLFIFGDNIENRIGHFRYFIFYILSGILASIAHVYTTKITGGNLLVPTLGASGAISGVLGAYMMLFPTRRVVVLLFYFITEVPAIVAIGIWFVFQLISGIGVLGAGTQEGGVAYGAHVGGFIAGFILIRFFTIGMKR